MTRAAVAERIACEERRRLLSLARSRAASPQDAEDAVQEALLGLVQTGPSDRAEAFSYAARSVVNRTHKQARRRQRRPTTPLGEAALAAVPDDVHAQVERRETIAGLRRVNPDWMRALYAVGLGLSHEEVRRATGLSERQVRRRITKARAKLRELEKVG
jgi:RNA polymerase sigma factor (sigma-70 family)